MKLNNCCKVLVDTRSITEKQWLDWRKKGIGSSDASTALGINRWESPMELYLDKTGQLPMDEELKESAYWGNTLEPIIADEFKKRNEGYRVERCNKILQSVKYPFMLANVDRLIYHKEKGWGVLEIKTSSEYLNKYWVDDELPNSYMLQVQHQLYITGYDYAYIAALVGGNKYKQKLIERDEELIELIINGEQSFWECVKNETPPVVDGSEASSEILNKMYVESNGLGIELESKAERYIQDYNQADEMIELYKRDKEEAKNKLKELLKDYEVGYIGEKKIIWKTYETNRLDIKALKGDCPDIFEKYIKKGKQRRFTIK